MDRQNREGVHLWIASLLTTLIPSKERHAFFSVHIIVDRKFSTPVLDRTGSNPMVPTLLRLFLKWGLLFPKWGVSFASPRYHLAATRWLTTLVKVKQSIQRRGPLTITVVIASHRCSRCALSKVYRVEKWFSWIYSMVVEDIVMADYYILLLKDEQKGMLNRPFRSLHSFKVRGQWLHFDESFVSVPTNVEDFSRTFLIGLIIGRHSMALTSAVFCCCSSVYFFWVLKDCRVLQASTREVH